MPKLVERADWNFNGNHYVQRVFAALDHIAERDYKYKSAGELPEAKIRELLGMEERSRWPRVAEFKHGRRAVSPEMLATLCDKGRISPRFLLLGENPMDAEEGAMRLLESKWFQLCREYAAAARDEMRVPPYRYVWMSKVFRLANELVINLDTWKDTVPSLGKAQEEMIVGLLDSTTGYRIKQHLAKIAEEQAAARKAAGAKSPRTGAARKTKTAKVKKKRG